MLDPRLAHLDQLWIKLEGLSGVRDGIPIGFSFDVCLTSASQYTSCS